MKIKVRLRPSGAWVIICGCCGRLLFVGTFEKAIELADRHINLHKNVDP